MDSIVLPSRARARDDLLTLSSPTREALLAPSGNSAIQSVGEIRSPQDVLSSLKGSPGIDSLKSCLTYLLENEHGRDGFHVRQPGPLAAQIIYVLVNDIVPSYWQVLSQDPSQRKTWRRLIKCLRSSAGISATLQRMKVLLNPSSLASTSTHVQQITNSDHLRIGVELLECLLHGDDTLQYLWSDIARLEPQKMKRTMIADGLVNLLATGNITSIAAQADLTLREKSKGIRTESWLGDGRRYSSWLGRNILHMSLKLDLEDTEAKQFRTNVLGKGLRLGYNEHLIDAIFSSALEGSPVHVPCCHDLLSTLPTFLQPVALEVVLLLLSRMFVARQTIGDLIAGSSALLKSLIGDNTHLLNHLVAWLTDFDGGNVGFPLEVFRAVVLLLSKDLSRLKKVLELSLERFGSKYVIQQTPMLQQEAQTKVMLVVAGYIHRIDEQYLQQVKRSSVYLTAISNRLSASSKRLQFFGMVVGMAISELVDKKESILNFDIEDVNSEEGEYFRELVKVEDSIGTIADLKSSLKPEAQPAKSQAQKDAQKAKKQPVQEAKSKIVAIEEVEDTESEDDLPVYAKPDSDPEDSDDDPTAINRNKPIAPVYIRDLLQGLRTDDNYDRHKLAIEHAPSLIRRKTNFGTEVFEHIDELAERLVGLKDSFNLEDFQQKRLQAMIAVIVAKPVEMGKWFANTYFNGDWSMSQRAAILSALAFAARELAGLKDDDADMTGVNEVPDFPTKRLPDRLAKMYQLEVAPVNRLVGKLERDIIKPLALEAADKATGPNVLKVRTFSSRMEVEKKRKRAIPNELAKVVADGFFYPLTGRCSSVVRARGDSSVFTSPFLLSQFLRTLALILSASGSSTLSLPGMTTEFWGLLLSAKSYAFSDQSVLEALLFANLTLLEINSNDQRRLAEDHANELMETQAWVQPVFENLRGGPKEEERVKMLASALLIKVKEVIEQYQKALLGQFAGRS